MRTVIALAPVVIAFLLLVGLSVTAEDWECGIVDTTVVVEIDTMANWIFPLWSEIPKDTTRYYIKEIKQKCDTSDIMTACLVYNCSFCKSQPLVRCHTDTTWADKVQVWLTPIQLEELMRIIERLKL